MKPNVFWPTCLILMFSVAAAQATPIASDSFATSEGGNDYDAYSMLLGQSATVGAHGFVGSWGNFYTEAFVPIPGGLTHELTPGETLAGQLISYGSNGTAGGGGGRNLSRAIDYTPSDGTYFMSVLLNKIADTTRGDLLVGLGSSQDPETSIFGVDGAFVGFLDGGISFVSGPGPNITTLLTAAQMNVAETYFALLQYDYTTSGTDTVTATIYDGSSSEIASQAFTGLNLDGRLGRFKVVTQDFGPIPVVDEWRFGTELSDVMSEPSPDVVGDANGDGKVNGLDYLVWAGNFGQPGGSPTIGDFDGNGVVNGIDYLLWAGNFGQGPNDSVAVPEPGSLALMVIGLAAWGVARRWR